MTDKIQIFDAFLTPEELEACASTVKRPAWSFGQISQTSPISTPFWMMTLTDDPFFSTQLKSKIETAANRKFLVQRVYANGQTFGQDGTYHQDDASNDSYTFCIYINKQITAETADDIGGEFVFKIPNQRNDDMFSRIAVAPLYNRGILFPSQYFHKGLAFNRYCKGLRVSIAWKLQLEH
jgi:hypothetical protein